MAHYSIWISYGGTVKITLAIVLLIAAAGVAYAGTRLFAPLFLIEITTLALLTLSPMVQVSKATFFSFASILVVLAVWGLSGFGYPSAPLPYALNVLSKILAFVTALSLFLPQRATASAPRPVPAGTASLRAARSEALALIIDHV
jgi:hypothetical protein